MGIIGKVFKSPAKRGKMSVKNTVPWFLDETGVVAPGTFKFLNCGEAAFGEIYRAISAAKRSVNYICWGFQPSMHFVRNSGSDDNLSIGALLEKKASEGVKVKVLCWSMDLIFDMNVQAAFSHEPNTSGRRILSIKDRTKTTSNEQFAYDKIWFFCYDQQHNMSDLAADVLKQFEFEKPESWKPWTWHNDVKRMKENWEKRWVEHVKEMWKYRGNLEFRGRDFSLGDRERFATKDNYATDVYFGQRALYTVSPTHHQKMILIDHELPEDHVGFVMGHNTLDEYWDTTGHKYHPRWNSAKWWKTQEYLDFKTGRNGENPRQDVSSRVTGPIVQALFENFDEAWTKAGGKALPPPPIRWDKYPLDTTKLGMPGVTDPHARAAAVHDMTVMANVVRTYTTGVRWRHSYGIRDSYLHVIKMATKYIYAENQFFRWEPFAKAVLEAANVQFGAKRDTAEHGSLYLFVVTNSSDEGVGPGTQTSYEMMEMLGRADTIPNVARENRVKELKRAENERDAAQKAVDRYQKALDSCGDDITKQQQFDINARRTQPGYGKNNPALDKKWDTLNKNRDAAQARLDKQKAVLAEKQGKLDEVEAKYGKRSDVEQKNSVIQPTERPGLKIHLCSLTTSPLDTPEKVEWPEVYIHSKLMLINDTYMTLGSANINERSMEADTEMNICHFNPNITQKVRKELWNQHTCGMGGQDDVKVAFKKWQDIIEKNRDKENEGKKPIAHLRGLLISQKKGFTSTFD